MIARHETNHRNVWGWILAILVTLVVGLSALTVAAQSAASQPARLTRAEIQAALDATGYCWIPSGIHFIDGPVVVRANMTLEGAGKLARLYVTNGSVGIQYGQPPGEKPNAILGAYVRNISVVRGSLVCYQIANHCDIQRVWVSDSPGDGFLIRSYGERIKFAECVAWGNRGWGFRVETYPDGNTNGVVFDHCTASTNDAGGMLLASGDRYATLTHTIIRDCTIQSNGPIIDGDLDSDGDVDLSDVAVAQQRADLSILARTLARLGTVSPAQADIVIRGSVHGTRIESTWIEPTKTGVGLLIESANQARGKASPELTICGASMISVANRAAIISRDALSLTLDGLEIGSGKRTVEYSGTAPRITPPRVGVTPLLVETMPGAARVGTSDGCESRADGLNQGGRSGGYSPSRGSSPRSRAFTRWRLAT